MTPGGGSLGKTAKKGVVWSFLREGVTEVIIFPTSLIAARLLSPAEFGVAAAALFFVQLAARLADLGFNAALVRTKTVTSHQISSVFVATFALGLACFGSLVLVAPWVARFYGIPDMAGVLRVGALSFLVVPIGSVAGALLVRDQRFRELSIIDWCYCLTFAGLSLGLAFTGFSYWSLIVARVASHVTQAAGRIWFGGWHVSPQFSSASLRELLSFGLGTQAKRLLDYAAGNVDNVIVGKVMGMTALGFYDKAFSTMNRFLLRLNTGGPTTLFRVFAIIHEDRDRFRRAYNRVMLSACLMGFPVLAVLVAAAPQMMVVLFGSAWLPAADPFRALGIAGMFRLVNAYASSAIQGFGKVWLEVVSQVAYLALIVGGIFAMRSRGVQGAAEAVLLATAVMTLLMHALLGRVTGLRWLEMLRPQVPGLVCAAGAGALVLALEMGASAVWGRVNPLALLVMQFGAAAAWGLAFLLVFPSAEMREVVGETVNDLAPASLRAHHWFRRGLSAMGMETAR